MAKALSPSCATFVLFLGSAANAAGDSREALQNPAVLKEAGGETPPAYQP